MYRIRLFRPQILFLSSLMHCCCSIAVIVPSTIKPAFATIELCGCSLVKMKALLLVYNESTLATTALHMIRVSNHFETRANTYERCSSQDQRGGSSGSSSAILVQQRPTSSLPSSSKVSTSSSSQSIVYRMH